MNTLFTLRASLLCIACCFIIAEARSQGESFSAKRELNRLSTLPSSQRYRLSHPFEMVYGPDDFLYVTEKTGRVLRINSSTGARRILLNISSSVFLTITRNSSGAATSVGQDGLLGLALHPNFGQGVGKDSVYIAYCYDADPGTAVDRRMRIARYFFTGGSSPVLNGATTLLQGIPASNDHSSGRLLIGPDLKLYYTCGDMGHNQFGNKCKAIRAQDLPTAADITAANYNNYAGKILRINMNGSIPADNPLFNGVQSHIYTIGHRNPQGLVFETAPFNGYPLPVVNGKLYSSEQGPKVDDEINLITAGKNYGWPLIAGNQDDLNYTYYNYSSAGAACNPAWDDNANPATFGIAGQSESAALVPDFQAPLKNMYTTCGSNPTSVCNLASTNFLLWPTIAPSSLDFYWNGAIPGWGNSLLVPSLKKGTLYRYKLNATNDGFTGDSIPYFRDGNRYRDIAINKTGTKIYILTDSIGSTSGPTGGTSSSLINRGAILEFTYTGPVLRSSEFVSNQPSPVSRIYPNPARTQVTVELRAMNGAVRYQVLDASGKLLQQGNSSQPIFTIPLSGLQPGVYLLRLLQDNRETAMEKIIVQ